MPPDLYVVTYFFQPTALEDSDHGFTCTNAILLDEQAALALESYAPNDADGYHETRVERWTYVDGAYALDRDWRDALDEVHADAIKAENHAVEEAKRAARNAEFDAKMAAAFLAGAANAQVESSTC